MKLKKNSADMYMGLGQLRLVLDAVNTPQLEVDMDKPIFDEQSKHIMEDMLYFEVVDIETGEPVAPGERGNMVVTVFFRNVPPIIRYNLRDLGRLLPDSLVKACGCGSHFRRMDHFLGRSDAMVKLRGVNVYPMACLPAIKSDERTTGEWVCVVTRSEGSGAARDEMLAAGMDVVYRETPVPHTVDAAWLPDLRRQIGMALRLD